MGQGYCDPRFPTLSVTQGVEGPKEWRSEWASGELGILEISWGHSSVNFPDIVVKCMGSEVIPPRFKTQLPQ